MFVVFRHTLLNKTLTDAVKHFNIEGNKSLKIITDPENHYKQLVDSNVNGGDHLKVIMDISTPLSNGFVIDTFPITLITNGKGSPEVYLVERMVELNGGEIVLGAVLYQYHNEVTECTAVDFFINGDINTLNPPNNTREYHSDRKAFHDDLFGMLLKIGEHPFGVVVDTILTDHVLTIPGEEFFLDTKCSDRHWFESAVDYVMRDPAEAIDFLKRNSNYFNVGYYQDQEVNASMDGTLHGDDFNTTLYHSVLLYRTTTGSSKYNVLREQLASALILLRNAELSVYQSTQLIDSLCKA